LWHSLAYIRGKVCIEPKLAQMCCETKETRMTHRQGTLDVFPDHVNRQLISSMTLHLLRPNRFQEDQLLHGDACVARRTGTIERRDVDVRSTAVGAQSLRTRSREMQSPSTIAAFACGSNKARTGKKYREPACRERITKLTQLGWEAHTPSPRPYSRPGVLRTPPVPKIQPTKAHHARLATQPANARHVPCRRQEKVGP